MRVVDWVVTRTRAAQTVDQVVVATSSDASDDSLARFCSQRGYSVFRGDLHDVLKRMADAAATYDADIVVRITADCPMVDPAVIDQAVLAHRAGNHDFTANRLPPPAHRTFPIGLDVEVVSRGVLDTAAREATARPHREHVMPYVYENADRFDVRVIDSDQDAGDARWTVDTQEDLKAVSHLVRAASATPGTSWQELHRVWRNHPEFAAINASIVQRTVADLDPRSPGDTP